MQLKRIDPLNNIIFDYKNKCNLENYSYTDSEKELEKCKNNNLERIGVALYMIEAFPDRVRGYLAAYDSLDLLGYSGDAENILRNYLLEKKFHILVAIRLINRYISKCFYDDALDIISLGKDDISKELSKNDGLKKTITHMYKTMCLVDDYEKVSGDLDYFKKNDILILSKKMELASYDEQVSIISSLIASENYGLASLGFWFANNLGNRSRDFFELAVKNLFVENDSSPRSLYFRDKARKIFENDLNFIDYAIQANLHRGEIERAESILIGSIYSGVYDERILNHAVRISALTGFLDSSLISQAEWKNFELARYYLWQRQKSLAAWSLDKSKVSILDNIANKKNLFNLVNFVPRSFGIMTKRSKRVALLVSGQLRGSEKNMKENILSLSKEMEADVFMDVWDEQVMSPPRFNHLYRFLGNDLVSKLPEEARYVAGFKQYFPLVFKKLNTPIRKIVNEGDLINDYSCLAARVESEKDFNDFCESFCPGLNFRSTFNQAKMFYKIHQSYRLLEKYEIDNNVKYDVVVRFRPDLSLRLPIVSPLIDAVVENRNLIYVSYVNNVGFSDQFAIGSRYAMKLYCSIWQQISLANSFRYLPYLDPWVLHAAEPMMAAHLAATGLNIRVIKPLNHVLNTPLIINEIDISEEIKMDANNILDLDVKDFVDHYFSIKNNSKKFC